MRLRSIVIVTVVSSVFLGASGLDALNSAESIDFLIEHTKDDFVELLDAVSKDDVPEWPVGFSSTVALPLLAADRLESDLLRGLYHRFLLQLENFQPTLQKLPPKKFHKRITQLIQLRDHIAKRRTYTSQVLINAINAVLFVELTKQIVLRRDVSDEMQEHIRKIRALKTDPADILALVVMEVGEQKTLDDLDKAARKSLGNRIFDSSVEAGFLDSERFRRIGSWVKASEWDVRTETKADQIKMQQMGFVPSLGVRNIADQLRTLEAREANIHIHLPALALYVKRSAGAFAKNWQEIDRLLVLTKSERSSLGSNIAPLLHTHSVSYALAGLIKDVGNGFIHFRALFDIHSEKWKPPKEQQDAD